MYEGKIIKFYREKAGMTQEQLGKGICSTTHISKIERGLTEYSSEISSLLANKLNINLDDEIIKLMNLKEKLDLWHEMIISLNMQAASDIYNELINNELIKISKYQVLYQLLSLKYNIKQGNLAHTHREIKKLPKDYTHLPLFEKNLYKHVVGIYEMAMNNHSKAIIMLKSINYDQYSNALVYYDLATAYHYNNLTILAYYYAEKALSLYKQKNNFLGIIDAENLMIIQIESDSHRDFKETTEKYNDLITLCDLCHAPDKKAKLLHNFGYECLRRRKYSKALKLYKQSMELKEKYTGIYLLSLEGYIRAGFEGKQLSQEELLKKVREGLDIAKEIKDDLYTVVLTLHRHAILGQEKQYYKHLKKKALPFLKKQGYILIAEKYERELFSYYFNIGEKDKALKIAESLIGNPSLYIL